MISFGPSEVAVYFLVRNKDLQKAVEAIHTTFFTKRLVAWDQFSALGGPLKANRRISNNECRMSK